MKLWCINYAVTESVWIEGTSGGLQFNIQLKAGSAMRPHRVYQMINTILFFILLYVLLTRCMFYFLKCFQHKGMQALLSLPEDCHYNFADGVGRHREATSQLRPCFPWAELGSTFSTCGSLPSLYLLKQCLRKLVHYRLLLNTLKTLISVGHKRKALDYGRVVKFNPLEL